MQVKSDQYIFPPRSQDAVPRDATESFRRFGWIAQLKYNDSRCIVKYCVNGTVELWNRHAERFRSYVLPDDLRDQLLQLRAMLGLSDSKVSMLDGGLLDQKHQAIKDTLVVWDILVRDDTHLLGSTLADRYDSLQRFTTENLWLYEHPQHAPVNFGHTFTPDIFLPNNWDGCRWDEAWDVVNTVNAPFTHGKYGDPDYEIKPVLEGLVFKNPKGELGMGFNEKNNDEWMMRSRVPTGRHPF